MSQPHVVTTGHEEFALSTNRDDLALVIGLLRRLVVNEELWVSSSAHPLLNGVSELGVLYGMLLCEMCWVVECYRHLSHHVEESIVHNHSFF